MNYGREEEQVREIKKTVIITSLSKPPESIFSFIKAFVVHPRPLYSVHTPET